MLYHSDATTAEGRAYLKQANAARRAASGEEEAPVEEIAEEMEEGVEEATLDVERYALGAREQFVLAVSQTGYGKRTSSYEYRVTGRGGSGIVAMGMGKKNAQLIAAFPVEDSDDLMLISDGGRDHPGRSGRHFGAGSRRPGCHRVPPGRRRTGGLGRAHRRRRRRGMSARRRVGLYPGSFDPVTLGHLDIVKRAVKLVDHLVIGVATGTGKAPLFSLDGTGGGDVAPRGGRLGWERRHHRGPILLATRCKSNLPRALALIANIVRGLRARCRTSNMNSRWWRGTSASTAKSKPCS